MEFTILYRDEECWLGEYYDSSSNLWVLGTEVVSWSPSKYKKYLSILASVLNSNDKPYVSFVKGEKEKKFNLLFGFRETGIKFMHQDKEYEVLHVR